MDCTASPAFPDATPNQKNGFIFRGKLENRFDYLRTSKNPGVTSLTFKKFQKLMRNRFP